jgi:hypothetical protein
MPTEAAIEASHPPKRHNPACRLLRTHPSSSTEVPSASGKAVRRVADLTATARATRQTSDWLVILTYPSTVCLLVRLHSTMLCGKAAPSGKTTAKPLYSSPEKESQQAFPSSAPSAIYASCLDSSVEPEAARRRARPLPKMVHGLRPGSVPGSISGLMLQRSSRNDTQVGFETEHPDCATRHSSQGCRCPRY